MKKLLLASTALVMSAGVAAADVALSGDGRMGLVYDGNDVNFDSRARVTFTLSGETSTGLAFGGSFRADQAGAASGTAGNIFIEGEFGKLAMGDVDNAALAAVGDLHFGSLTGLDDRNEMAYLGRLLTGLGDFADEVLGLSLTDDQIDTLNFTGLLPRALYSYSIDGFSFFASVDNPVVERDDDGSRLGSLQNIAVGASYTFEGFTGAIGYEDARLRITGDDNLTAKHLIASAAYEFEGFEIKGIAGRVSGDLGTLLSDTPGLRRDQYGLSVSGSFEEVTVTAFGNRNFVTTDYGIGAAYDLGGGASLTGGIVRTGSNSDFGIDSETTADFGLSFTF